MYAGIVEYIFIGHGQHAIRDAQAVIEAGETNDPTVAAVRRSWQLENHITAHNCFSSKTKLNSRNIKILKLTITKGEKSKRGFDRHTRL